MTYSSIVIVPTGGAGRGVAAYTEQQAALAGLPRIQWTIVDTARRDPHAAVPPDRHQLDADPSGKEFVLLRPALLKEPLEAVAAGTGVLPDFPFIDQTTATYLLKQLPDDSKGAAQEPLISRLALAEVDPRVVDHKLRDTVRRAREEARESEPLIVVVGGVGAGGTSPGTLPEVVHRIKELCPTGTIVVFGFTPEAWEVHAEDGTTVEHQQAKTIATVWATRDAGAEYVYLFGAGRGAYANARPTEGVIPAVGAFALQIAARRPAFDTMLVNWRRLLSDDRPFSTAGHAELDTLAKYNAARLSHSVAERALSIVLEPEASALEPVPDQIAALVSGFEECREVSEFQTTPKGEICVVSRPGHDRLARTGDPASPPPDPPGAPDLPRPALKADVQQVIEEMLAQDKRGFAEFLSAKRERARHAFTAYLREYLGRQFPSSGIRLADDPAVVRRELDVLEGAANAYTQAAERLDGDVADIEQSANYVAGAESELDAALQGLPERVRRRQLDRCVRVAMKVIEARRWMAAAVDAAGLYGELGRLLSDGADPIRETIMAFRAQRRDERRELAEAERRIEVTAALPHMRAAIEPGSPAQNHVDRSVLRQLCGDTRSDATHALGMLRLGLREQDGVVRMVAITAGGNQDADRDAAAGKDVATVAPCILSRLLSEGTPGQAGIEALYIGMPLVDVLGFALEQWASQVTVSVDEDAAEAFASETIEALNEQSRPLAPLRSDTRDQLDLPEAIRVVVADGRAPRTASGTLVAEALTRRTRESGASTSHEPIAIGRLAVTQHIHGLGIDQLRYLASATDAYYKCSTPIHTDLAGETTYRIERSAREAGRRPGSWRLDPAVRREIVPHLKVAMAAALLLAHGSYFKRDEAPDGSRVLTAELVERGLNRRIVLGPVSDPSAVILGAVRARDDLREPLLAEVKRLEHSWRRAGDEPRVIEERNRLLDSIKWRRDGAALDPADLELSLLLAHPETPEGPAALVPASPAGVAEQRPREHRDAE